MDRQHLMKKIDRQDVARSARPVLFYTGIDDFQYATHGGTAFVVIYNGRPYAITCRHVFKDFDEGQLTIYGAQFPIKGHKSAKIKTICYASLPIGFAADSEVTDFCVIEFDDGVSSDFFDGCGYPLDKRTICLSAPLDRLMVFGAVKENTSIDPPNINVGFGRLEAHDKGPSADPFMRYGTAYYINPGFSDPTGLSGSPTFNLTRNGLCGMVTRATLQKRRFNFMYAEAADLLRFVAGVSERSPNIFYAKQPPK
jgi:hypothetical protein